MVNKILLVLAESEYLWNSILNQQAIRLRPNCKVYVFQNIKEARTKSLGLCKKSTRFVSIGPEAPWKIQASQELGIWFTGLPLNEAFAWLQGPNS